jgi:type IV secretory pathway VirB10-like protein
VPPADPRQVPPGEDPHELDLELTGEAEASRQQPARRRWPWILVMIGAPFAGLVLWTMFRPGAVPTPKAMNITSAPVPPLERGTYPQGPANIAAGPTTPPPGGLAPPRATQTREPGRLVQFDRTLAQRKADAERREAQENERKEAAAQRTTAAQQVAAKANEARPGVNQAGEPWINPHPEFTIPSHTPISCTPDGPINSESIGPVSCTIDTAVRSEDGTNYLLWPGAVIDGYLGQGLQGGQRRLALTMDRIRGTGFERIPLRGMGASALGENGITGTYDSHLWEKIQAGVMLTLVEGAVDAAVGAASSAASGDEGGTFLNFGRVGSRARGTLGQTALQRDYNRPGSVRRDHADPITIKTIGDLDLSKLYELVDVRAQVNSNLARSGLPPLRKRQTRR